MGQAAEGGGQGASRQEGEEQQEEQALQSIVTQAAQRCAVVLGQRQPVGARTHAHRVPGRAAAQATPPVCAPTLPFKGRW